MERRRIPLAFSWSTVPELHLNPLPYHLVFESYYYITVPVLRISDHAGKSMQFYS